MYQPIPRHQLRPAMSINERRRIVDLPCNAEKGIWELARELGVCYETIRTDRIFLAQPASERPEVPELLPEQPPDDPAPYDSSDAARHHARILKTAKRWLIDERLDHIEVEWITPKTAQLFGFQRGIQKIPMPPPTMSPEDAILKARPGEHNSDCLDWYPVWLFKWLDLCLPGDGQAQNKMLIEIFDLALHRAQANSLKARRAREARKQKKAEV